MVEMFFLLLFAFIGACASAMAILIGAGIIIDALRKRHRNESHLS